jgi:phage FluMu gp28-like protein
MPVLELLPYQKACIQDRSRLKVLCWARGARKTFTVTLEIVMSCFEAEALGRRTKWLILSASDHQAILALAECKKHCQTYLADLPIHSTDVVDENGLKRYTQHVIRFPKGSSIVSRPANADTVRGETANVFWDEACLLGGQDAAIWRAIFPITRGRLRMIVASTPKGGSTRVFHKLLHSEEKNKDGSPIWSKHICNIYDAVRQGLTNFDIEAERAAIGDPDGWAQEYELAWLDEISAWLPFALITSCEHYECGETENYQGGSCYVGVDVGRHRNLWVAWVVERVGDVLWTREVATAKNEKFEEHDAILDRIVRTYRVARICMDIGGMGEKPVEDAQRRYGESRVEGVRFTLQSKQYMATVGKQAFQKRLIRIPADNPSIRNDLYSLRRLETPHGNFRFDTEKGASAEAHADRAWALFLALAAAGERDSRLDYAIGNPSFTLGLPTGGGNRRTLSSIGVIAGGGLRP